MTEPIPTQRFGGTPSPADMERHLVAERRCRDLGLPKPRCENEMLAPEINDGLRLKLGELFAGRLPDSEAEELLEAIWTFRAIRVCYGEIIATANAVRRDSTN